MTFHTRFSCATFALLLAASSSSLQASSLSVYLSAPFTQTAGSSGNNATGGFANTSTEDFLNGGTAASGGTAANGVTTLNSAPLTKNTDTGITGTTLSKFAGTPSFNIIANDKYGGGGQGTYLGVPAGTSTTLTLAQPVGYFGLEWCAVDAGNSLTLYDQAGAAIGTFNAATFQSILPSGSTGTIKAYNGTSYKISDYFGQPTGTATAPSQNTGEQYAFLNFVGDPGTKISKIVFSETGATFESDNYAILTTAPTVDKSTSPLVFVSGVPEPSTVAMLVAAGGLMALTFGRRRRG